jgi:transcriptional regulator with GAF, ATPase, and Fis domain
MSCALELDLDPGKRVLSSQVLEERLQLLIDLNSRLPSDLAMSERLREFLTAIRGSIKCDSASIFLLDPEEPEFLRERAIDYEGASANVQNDCLSGTRGMMLRLIRTNSPEPVRVAAPELKGCAEGFKAVCHFPLVSSWNTCCGILSVARFEEHGFDGDEIGFLRELARAVANVIEHARAHETIAKLREQLASETVYLEDEILTGEMFEEIVGSSVPLERTLEHIARVAPTESTVLIMGESGTGKELVARAIHKRSRRANGPFIRVNCAAIPTALIASELFGHEKGAFTGALQRRLGRFELANRGTILLDEIGDIPAETQVALLRVLQEQEFERVGGNLPVSVDVRILAATNRDLRAAVDAGAFRLDLFYRLNVFPISVPPLRERTDDIPLLTKYFVERYATAAGKKLRSIDKRTLDLLQKYHWPGNIRELQNVIQRAVILCDRETLTIDQSWIRQNTEAISVYPVRLSDALVNRERDMIEAALTESRGRISGPSGAAVKLGIPRSTLESRIRSLRINKHRFREEPLGETSIAAAERKLAKSHRA